MSAPMMRAVGSLLLAVTLAPIAYAQPTPEQPEPAPSNEPSPPTTTTPTPEAPVNTAPTEPVAEPVPPPPPPPSEPAVVTPTPPPVDSGNKGFRFGSYGRIVAGTDLRGGKPEKVKIVAYGPRVVEDSYLELELSYGFETSRGMTIRPVITLAFDGTLFHDTGDFDAQPAIRNMYLDAQLSENTTAWVGSRMYRGDDIYLFDHWPLDDLNTVGGGIYHRRSAVELAAHAGVNRLNNAFQYQQIEVPNPEQGATTAVQLNRQRMLLSGSAAYLMINEPSAPSIKLKAHGEVHALASGSRKRDDGTFEALPSDTGFLVGGEASVFGMSDDKAYRRHLNLYARYAKGLAAFDELAQPTSFGPELKTNRANELVFGASGNWDFKYGNMMLGALSRRFVDADTTTTDADDGWEYAVDVRPLARVVPEIYAGVDLSYQARFPRGLNPNTQTAEDPSVLQIAPMIVYSPMGPSSYDRPQLRLVYRAARLNDAARNLYVPDDIRRDNTWVHFLGFQAEWWFNSLRYR